MMPLRLNLSKELEEVDFGEICKNCPVNCCKRFYAVLLPGEEGIERYITTFTIKTPYGDVKAIGSSEGAPCPALKEDGKCSIYRHRPVDCRIWPLVVYIDYNTGERVIYLDLECPRAREGKIPSSLINKLIKGYLELEIDDEWLKKYTAAPWPNNFVEIARVKKSELRNSLTLSNISRGEL